MCVLVVACSRERWAWCLDAETERENNGERLLEVEWIDIRFARGIYIYICRGAR